MKAFICLLFTACFLLFASGCGYSPLIQSREVTAIAVPVFENQTFWRGYEFELTNLVQGEILARLPNYRLVSDKKDADMILEGEITNISRPVLVEGVLDRTIQSQVVIAFKVSLKKQATGEIVYQSERVETGEFVGQRSENEDTARREVYEKLARWVTTILEAR